MPQLLEILEYKDRNPTPVRLCPSKEPIHKTIVWCVVTKLKEGMLLYLEGKWERLLDQAPCRQKHV